MEDSSELVITAYVKGRFNSFVFMILNILLFSSESYPLPFYVYQKHKSTEKYLSLVFWPSCP